MGNKEIKRKFVYRLQTPIKPNSRTYEIGVIELPISKYRKEYPDSWCDYRICEGFWGDEESVKKIVTALNDSLAYENKKEFIKSTLLDFMTFVSPREYSTHSKEELANNYINSIEEKNDKYTTITYINSEEFGYTFYSCKKCGGHFTHMNLENDKCPDCGREIIATIYIRPNYNGKDNPGMIQISSGDLDRLKNSSVCDNTCESFGYNCNINGLFKTCERYRNTIQTTKVKTVKRFLGLGSMKEYEVTECCGINSKGLNYCPECGKKIVR